MDNIQLLTTFDADGGLAVSSLFCSKMGFSLAMLVAYYIALSDFQASPRIRFNKDGTLLAVSANENGIKILANADGIRLLRTLENSMFDAARTSEAMVKVGFQILCFAQFLFPKFSLTYNILWQPAISPISAAAVATSGALADRGTSVVAITGMVCS